MAMRLSLLYFLLAMTCRRFLCPPCEIEICLSLFTDPRPFGVEILKQQIAAGASFFTMARQIAHFRKRGSPRNACAWDDKNYYYISYQDSGRQGKPIFVKIPLYRLPGFSGTVPPAGTKMAIPMEYSRYLGGVPGADPLGPDSAMRIEVNL